MQEDTAPAGTGSFQPVSTDMGAPPSRPAPARADAARKCAAAGQTLGPECRPILATTGIKGNKHNLFPIAVFQRAGMIPIPAADFDPNPPSAAPMAAMASPRKQAPRAITRPTDQ